jgi:thiol-disulfide isomerase/thioredoxin
MKRGCTMMLLLPVLFSNCKTMKKTTEMLGKQSLETVKSDASCAWLNNAYSYEADLETMRQLSEALEKGDYSWKVYAGCWCGDTKKLLPLFEAVLRKAGFPERKISYYFLDINKQSPEKEEIKDHIGFVPTFILYSEGQEKGRIVEKISRTMEAEILSLLLLP